MAVPVPVPVINWEGDEVGKKNVGLRVAFDTTVGVVHQCVMYERTLKRKGTASTKTRGEVRGGGRKPYKQKGTGRARRGSNRTPLRPGGGIIHGPKPKDWSINIDPHQYALGMGSTLQNIANCGDMKFIQCLNRHFAENPTIPARQKLIDWLAYDILDTPGILAANNKPTIVGTKIGIVVEHNWVDLADAMYAVPGVQLLHVNKVEVYDLLYNDKVLIEEAAWDLLEQKYTHGAYVKPPKMIVDRQSPDGIVYLGEGTDEWVTPKDAEGKAAAS